jgi:hypothetical protein
MFCKEFLPSLFICLFKIKIKLFSKFTLFSDEYSPSFKDYKTKFIVEVTNYLFAFEVIYVNCIRF